jgi:hypothetical protein
VCEVLQAAQARQRAFHALPQRQLALLAIQKKNDSKAHLRIFTSYYNGSAFSFVGVVYPFKKISLTHKRTEVRAPVGGSESTTKAAKLQGGSEEFAPQNQLRLAVTRAFQRIKELNFLFGGLERALILT